MTSSADISPEEIFDALFQLIESGSPEIALQVCEQEQHLLLHPAADGIFAYIIDESARREELQMSIPHLQLLRTFLQRARIVGIADAWAELVTYLEEQEREAIEAALDRFMQVVDTPGEREDVFAQEQALLLRERTDDLLLSMLARAEQVEGAAKQQAIDMFQGMRTFLALARGEEMPQAWDYLSSLIERLQQQEVERHRRIKQALNALAHTSTWEETQQILEREQEFLLTDEAEQIVASSLLEVEQSTNEGRDARRLSLLQNMRHILQRVREAGIEQGLVDLMTPENMTISLEQKSIFLLLDRWLRTPGYRQKRRFLEMHLDELLIQESEPLLQQIMASKPLHSRVQTIARFHLAAVRDTYRRGGTIQAVREAYVNISGGTALDLPAWLEQPEQQLETLRASGAGEQGLVQQDHLLREAITSADQDTTIAPEILAELHFLLGRVLGQYPKGNQTNIPTESLVAYDRALHIFTQERYPQRFAHIHWHLGDLHMKYQGLQVHFSSTTLLVSPRTKGLDLLSLQEPENEILEQPEEHLPMHGRQRASCHRGGERPLQQAEAGVSAATRGNCRRA
jgi:hypothetical protein